jgi:hypothetical protein
MGVIRVEVALAAAVHAPRRRIDPLLDGGVGDLLHQDADLQVEPPSGQDMDVSLAD